MYLVRRLQMLTNKVSQQTVLLSGAVRHFKNTEIEIPDRIERGPTDILYALASTVGKDPTAAHYKYHDDPYLTPTSNINKRTYAMSQEAGRKAASWIKNEHRQLFLHQEAQPPIEAFAPKMVFTEDSEVDESSLQQLIMQSQVTDAVFVYNLMKQKGIDISPQLRQSMLELLCFYNNEEPISDEYAEERMFKESAAPRERQRKTWKDGELAEQIFAEIEPKTATSYAALIRGMAKYYQVDRAYALLEEATEKQMELDTITFNYLISVSHLLRETADQRWSLCLELLQRMSQQQLNPDLGTMNALLECVSKFGNYKFARNQALKVLAEFKRLGIEPSLGTYYYILAIFCRDRAPVSHVIVDILNEIGDKEFTIRHPKDPYFFVTAMDVCRHHLHDKSIAKRVDKLLHVGRNYDLIGDTYRESAYYRHYFALLCQTEPIEEFMQTYDLLVPNIYIPEPGVMEEVLNTIEINAGIDLLPRIWSDMIQFDHINRESLLLRILKIMVNNVPNVSIPTQQELPKLFANIALDIYNIIEKSEGRSKKISFTGEMIGNILTLLVRGEVFEKATEVFTNIDKNQHRIPGTPSEDCLLEFIESCIANKAPSPAIACLQYAVENNMESLTLGKKINSGFTLNEVHLSKMKSLLGDSFLDK